MPNSEASEDSSTRRGASVVLACEVIGFLAIITLSWINELLGLPRLIFGSSHVGGWHESLLETAIVLLVAMPVAAQTRRLLARLHYLEEFPRLCAWCRKLHLNNEWVPVEQFLQRKFDTQISHGICPACRRGLALGPGQGA